MSVYGNAAYQLDYQESVSQQADKKTKIVRRVKKKNNSHHKRSAMMLIGVTFALCIGVLMSSAMIAETNYQMNQLGKEYKNAVKVNSELNVQLMRGTNLDYLENIAINKLGMQYPEQYQYSYVNVKPVEAIEVASLENYYKAEVKPEATPKIKMVVQLQSAVSSALKLLNKKVG